MEGWIKIHRKIIDNPLWFSEKFTRGQAWIDLILLANHADSYFFKRGVKINVSRGQLSRSSVELGHRWKWSRSKVNKFLNDLEKEQQIKQQKSNVNLIVTIINYDLYQQKEQQIEQQKDSKKTAKRQQKDTYKNDNNEENEKEEKEEKIKFDFKKSFIDLGVEKQILDDWMVVRKTKKGSNTKTAFELIANEIQKSQYSANDCIKICVEKNWLGFKSKWLDNIELTIKPIPKPPQQKKPENMTYFEWNRLEKAKEPVIEEEEPIFDPNNLEF